MKFVSLIDAKPEKRLSLLIGLQPVKSWLYDHHCLVWLDIVLFASHWNKESNRVVESPAAWEDFSTKHGK